MELIPASELSTLKPATTVHTIAANAAEIHLKGAVARAINGAANTGEYSVVWNDKLTDTLKQELIDNGYEIEEAKDAYRSPINGRYIISWK